MKKLLLVLFLFAVIPLCSQSLVQTVPLANDGYLNYGYGLTFANGNLWISSSSSTNGKGIIKSLDNNGQVVSTVTMSYPTIKESQGLAFDGTNFWYVERKISRCDLFKISSTGTVLDSIPIRNLTHNVDWTLGGAAWHDGYLWISCYYPNADVGVYKIDIATESFVDTIKITRWDPSTLQHQGVTFKGDTLFVVNDGFEGTEKIYAVSLTTKDTLFTFNLPETPGVRQNPRGLAWDGTYFWLLAEPVGASSGKSLFKYTLSSTGTPGIAVLTPTLNYGNVQIDSTLRLDAVIQNVGTADLRIDSVKCSNPAFIFESSFPLVINTNGSRSIPVAFKPTGLLTYNDSIKIYHNDPSRSSMKITLLGSGVYTAAYISPSVTNLDYGNKRKGSTGYQELTLSNTGSARLKIDSLKLSNPSYRLDAVTLPLYIDSVSSKTLTIWAFPSEYGALKDTLKIYSNASNGTLFKIPVSTVSSGFDSTLGNIVWSGYIPDNPNTTLNDPSVKSIQIIDDINNDGVADLVMGTDNYWIIAYNGNSSNTSDVLWKFNTYHTSNSAGSIEYVQNLKVGQDINNDGFRDVFAGTQGGSEAVFAIDGKTGAEIWENDPTDYSAGDIMGLDVKRDFNNDGVNDVLAAASGNESSGAGRFSVLCLNGKTGVELWRLDQSASQKLKYMVTSTDDGGAVGSRVGTTNEVTGFNKQGLLTWSFPTQGTPWTVMEMVNVGGEPTSDILVGTMNGVVYCLSGDAGYPIWQNSIGNYIIEDLRVISDVNLNGTPDVLVCGIAQPLFVFDGKTGQQIWQNTAGGSIVGLSELVDITGDGYPEVGTVSWTNVMLNVFNAKTGENVFSRSMGSSSGETGEILAPMADVDGDGAGEFVVGTRDGKIYAFSGGPFGVVPVELSTFTASTNDNNVTLMWNTATETNNSGFYIERKAKDGTFAEVGFIKGKGTTTETQNYIFVDKNLTVGGYAYRLKQVDYDGTFKYTNSVEVNIGLPVKYTLSQNYPNPFNPSTVINYSLPFDGFTKLRIYNVTGEEVATLVNDFTKAGNYSIQWNGNNSQNVKVPSGMYLYRLESGNFTETRKMILIK
ncbi:MAG TPA: choice-of-anchor D domain-containing protein [Ignavibacteriaceae bacterium]|nr:choice-of-anchor D domain-containing protein [Ignavibacteriaceae bacterium]